MRTICIILTIFIYSATFAQEHKHDHEHTGDHHHDHDHSTGDENKVSTNEYMNSTKFSKLVAAFEDPEREKWQLPNAVIAKLGDLSGKTIMDLGAGTGYFSFRLAEKGAKVIAADIDQRFLDYIEKKMKTEEVSSEKIELRKVPTDWPSLEKEEVDAVLMVNTYHHIEARVLYFKKVMFGLKPGGKLVIVDYFNWKTPHGPPVEHRISLDVVQKELTDCGYKVTTDTNTLQEQYIVIATR
ncbi:MAG: methyltransferase domain-containing protein [Bacteroidetes bacterium]|nr:methyltransferase domain-containing protein [Bacteroidota bacterium]